MQMKQTIFWRRVVSNATGSRWVVTAPFLLSASKSAPEVLSHLGPVVQ